MKIKQGDKVQVITGKNKGKTGTVMRVIEKHNRIVVEGVNMITRHIRKTPNRPGERVKYEAPFDASNAMVLCPKTQKPTRIGYKTLENGKKVRIAKVSGEQMGAAPKKAKAIKQK